MPPNVPLKQGAEKSSHDHKRRPSGESRPVPVNAGGGGPPAGHSRRRCRMLSAARTRGTSRRTGLMVCVGWAEVHGGTRTVHPVPCACSGLLGGAAQARLGPGAAWPVCSSPWSGQKAPLCHEAVGLRSSRLNHFSAAARTLRGPAGVGGRREERHQAAARAAPGAASPSEAKAHQHATSGVRRPRGRRTLARVQGGRQPSGPHDLAEDRVARRAVGSKRRGGRRSRNAPPWLCGAPGAAAGEAGLEARCKHHGFVRRCRRSDADESLHDGDHGGGPVVQSAFRRAARSPDQNMADLKAQVAANETGRRELSRVVAVHGAGVVAAYMGHVQRNAEECVRAAIGRLQDGEFRYPMDIGTTIHVKVVVNHKDRSAVVDFTGTSPQHEGNYNAPQAVTRAVVLYVFRTLVGKAIPLNEGCLAPLTIIVPEGSLLNPKAPGGGNRWKHRGQPVGLQRALRCTWAGRCGAGHDEQLHLGQRPVPEL